MTILIDQPHLVDTLRFRIQAQKTIAQEDVRVDVVVHALVRTGDRDRGALERRIREALAAFVPTDWTLARIERAADAAGYERVRLTASARVPVAENFALTERAREASREGLTLAEPKVSYAVSSGRLGEVLAELRLQAMRDAQEQAVRFSEISGRAWRIGDIAFGVEDVGSYRRPTGKGAYRDFDGLAMYAQPSDDDADDEEHDGMAGAERIYLIATVTLKADAGSAQ